MKIFKKKNNKSDIDEFIKELEETTEIGKQFIDAAGPILEQLYQGVTAERRKEVLKTFKETMTQQAETEIAVAKALIMANDMGSSFINVTEKLEEMKNRMKNRHAEVASILIRSCGGFGGEKQESYEA